jgi:hypothetical protein
MNRCDLIRDELKAYLDGQLPFMQRQQVRHHLKGCAACRKELSAMEQTGNQLKLDAPTPLEASLRAKILSAAEGVGPKAGDRPKAPSKWRRKPVIAWAVAATALTAWCLFYPLTHFTQPNASTASDVAAGRQAMAPATTGAVAASAPTARTMSGGLDALPLGDRQKLAQFTASASSVTTHSPARQETAKQPFNPNSIDVTSDYWRERPQGSAAEQAGRIRMAGKSVRAGEVSLPSVRMSDYQSGVKSVFVHMRRPNASAAKSLAPYAQDYDEATRTVHKEAQITVQVDNVEAKSEAVEQIAQGVGGFVADNNLNTGDDGLKTASLTLKVPVAQFQSVLNQVARQGEVKAKSLSGQDLTEEISDQKQSEHTLREDVQNTQQQLTQRLSRMGREERMDALRELRTQLAQKQARLKLLQKLGTLSTISVELDEKPRPVPVKPQTSGFMNEMNETLQGAVQSMIQAARLPILTFIWILAYAPLWILLILGYRWAVRR